MKPRAERAAYLVQRIVRLRKELAALENELDLLLQIQPPEDRKVRQ